MRFLGDSDLEASRDLAKLDDPFLALDPLRGLVVLDEVQRRPEIFSTLRVLADRPRGARFLVLGSASPELLRQTSETLAGRMAFHELGGLSLDEVTPRRSNDLWLRGGFPRSFVEPTPAGSLRWRQAFIDTFVERDLPQLGVRVPGTTRPDQCYFWATHAGAELDFLVVAGTRRLGFEIKRTVAPRATPSMHAARRDLSLDSLSVIHAGPDTFPIADGIRAIGLPRILDDVPRLAS